MSVDVMARTKRRLRAKPGWLANLYAGNARAVIGRGFRVIRTANWGVIATGFFEPVFYLLAMGVGMGALVGSVPGPDGQPISYAMYIAPALLATSAMNGAIRPRGRLMSCLMLGPSRRCASGMALRTAHSRSICRRSIATTALRKPSSPADAADNLASSDARSVPALVRESSIRTHQGLPFIRGTGRPGK